MSIFCDSCGDPIKGNVQGKATCWRCTDKRVQRIEQLEELARIEIHNQQDHVRAIALAEDRGQKDVLIEQLKKIRKSLGLSQRLMALELGICQTYYVEMERGRKPLTQKILDLIHKEEKRLNALLPLPSTAPPDFGVQNAIDNKQIARPKK
jgi:DNA-binding transcriptional regulator YiaG